MPENLGSKVKIVPAHLWPSNLSTGVYDVLHNVILIKEGLPQVTREQTLKHENTHREWFLEHTSIKKLYNIVYWSPAYYVILILAIALYLSSILLWWESLITLSFLICFLLIIFYYAFDLLLEFPAWREAGVSIAEVSITEQVRLAGIKYFPIFLNLFLLMSLPFRFLDAQEHLALLSIGFSITWVWQFSHIWALAKLSKKGSF